MVTNNITNIGNVTSFMNLANESTGGWFWAGMIFMVWCVAFISMLMFGIEVALLAASFGALMFGILFVSMGLVSWTWVVIYAGVILITFFWIMYSKRE